MGKIVQVQSESRKHQSILAFLHSFLALYVAIKELGRVYLRGYTMYISDDLLSYQPDLMVVFYEHLDRSKHNHLEGPADIAVEIVSSITSTVDRGDKLIEYERVGVREYWLVDPLREEFVVYTLHEDGHYRYLPLAGNAYLVSKLLPDFSFDTPLLWQEEPPTGQNLLDILHKITS